MMRVGTPDVSGTGATSNATWAGASGLMATHPPIVERINRLRALTGEAPIDQQSAAALAGLD